MDQKTYKRVKLKLRLIIENSGIYNYYSRQSARLPRKSGVLYGTAYPLLETRKHWTFYTMLYHWLHWLSDRIEWRIHGPVFFIFTETLCIQLG